MDHQFISNTCHGFDLHRTLFKFLSQMRHMDIHCARLTVKVEAPGFLQDLLAAEDPSAVFGKGEEQVKFLGAQVEEFGKQAGPRGWRDQLSDRRDGWAQETVCSQFLRVAKSL